MAAPSATNASLEHPGLRHRVGGEACSLPFRAETFDLVTANMVVEHLPEPENALREVSRVLRPGGRFLIHTPNARGYSTIVSRLLPHRAAAAAGRFLLDRKAADVYPTFYRANTDTKLRRLAREAGLEVVELRHVASSGQAMTLPPLLVLELLLIRLLSWRSLERYRVCILATLQKPPGVVSSEWR